MNDSGTGPDSRSHNSVENFISLPDSEALHELPPDGGPNYNRLVFEKSPYLLQHALNPVDWYPWGEEAFQQAKLQDKPVFLSIGYATCHWCHVMESESFEDQDVAGLINKTFIPIKVDREERPDLDQIYMAVCQAVTGSGGWPLTVLLTPDKKPFFAGTYFPKESRFGRTGLLELIPKVADLWQENRDELLVSAEKITSHIHEVNLPQVGTLDQSVIQKAFQQLRDRYDSDQGGFGTAPKFPSPHNLIFLLRYWHQTGELEALDMVENTLQKMRLGGIYDQLGFGFHRYSTDAAWRLPHFEKMLYDQAMLALAYTEAYQATHKEEYARVVREILSYVLRDMTSPEGGFYSAEDADSEGEEGLFYLWREEEFQEYLGEKGAELFSDLFHLKGVGNYVDESSKIQTGLNLLYLDKPLAESAVKYNLTAAEISTLWETARQVLFQIREKRIHPLKDDKILSDWNGLMIAALAKAGAVLDNPDYLSAAKKAADFIWETLREDQGKLLKRYREGEAGLPAHLDDYAFLVWGLIEIYEADFDTGYLKKSLDLNQIMLDEFWDYQNGGLFFTTENQSDLIHRNKEIYDGALPSGNSIAANNLIRLGRLTSNSDFEAKTSQIGNSFANQINLVPQGYTQMLTAVLFASNPSVEVVISGNFDTEDTKEMIKQLRRYYSPQQVILMRPDQGDEWLFKLLPTLKLQTQVDGKATAYVCQNFQCSAPTTDPEVMIDLLK